MIGYLSGESGASRSTGLMGLPRTGGLLAAVVMFAAAATFSFANGSSEKAAPQQNASTNSSSNCGTSSPATINFYSGGDVNVHDLWANDILPAFKKVCSNITVNLVFSEHATGDQLTFDKIAAAKQSGKSSGVDVWETGRVLQAGEAGLAVKISQSDIPNLSKVSDDVLAQDNYYGVPYRGSSVIIAYNSKNVSDPPKTLNDLFSWIQQHPGKFTYNPPDTGGSGDNFVQAVLKIGINASDMKTFQRSYDQSMESQWDAGWQKLKALGASMYQGGFYPKGNAGVLDLLGKGTIDMAPAWSDQALSYLQQGLLPPEIKLEQLDPPFNGGASYIAIIADSQNKPADFAFMNFVLTPDVQSIVIDKMNGYPGVEWQYVPSDVREKFSAIAKSYSFGFSPKFDSDLHQLWYQKVASASNG